MNVLLLGSVSGSVHIPDEPSSKCLSVDRALAASAIAALCEVIRDGGHSLITHLNRSGDERRVIEAVGNIPTGSAVHVPLSLMPCFNTDGHLTVRSSVNWGDMAEPCWGEMSYTTGLTVETLETIRFAVLIGGAEDDLKVTRMIRSAGTPVWPIGSTGGAAGILLKESMGFHPTAKKTLAESTAYGPIFEGLLSH